MLCIAEVVVDIYGLHGAKRNKGGRLASGGPSYIFAPLSRSRVPIRMGPPYTGSMFQKGTGSHVV